ncbi:TonB-dependent siderophore receptor [Steroidobacter sp.]|uniref:TonB-dependent siderophore receptor n=1 Tax=Steroidobacter sp. TaxID=1978227 RepID=UPI001A457A3D|nr:TonB-dependent siderophore receptor [Steroidobacter sp.]MBL8267899.1 TonB-dependent siderophore receptor [Steroidobacter sp.]
MKRPCRPYKKQRWQLLVLPLAASVGLAQAAQTQPTAEELEEIVVQGKDLRGIDLASSATGFDIPLKDTPQSVRVISADLIELAGLRELEDISRLDASVTSGGRSRHARTLDLVFRGFEVDFTAGVLMDGFRLLSRGMPDFSNIERMEIVKGPVSSMYGQASLAGTVNLVAKKPLAEARQGIKLEGGDWDYYRGEFDSTGPLTEDARLRYRVTGALEDSGSFIDVVSSDKRVISPSLAYDFSPDTTVLVQSSLLAENLVSYRGQPMTSEGQLPNVPRSFFFGQDWNHFEREFHWAGATLTHTLPNGWKAGVNTQYNRSRNRSVEATAGYFPVQPDGSTDLSSGASDERLGLNSIEATLSGNFEAFSRQHSFFISVDRYTRDYTFDFRSNFPLTSGAPFNIYAPNYQLVMPEPLNPFAPVNADSFIGTISEWQRNLGVTAQMRLQITDPLSVLLGLRWDDSKLRNGFRSEMFGIDTVDTGMGSSQVVPQVGLVYAITNDLNVYVNYGETFLPQAEMLANGANIGPETGEQIEGGLKGTWLNSRVAYSLVYFDMTRGGLSTGDPANAGFYIPLGEQRSRGVEVEVSGEILPGWSVNLSATALDAEFTEGDYVGLQAPNTARRAVSLFSTYQVQEGALRDFGAGLGVTHKAGIKALGFGDFPQTSLDKVDQYTTVDLRLFYQPQGKPWELYLAAQNLLDEVYYFDSAGFGTRVQPGEPRRVVGGVKLTF